MQTFIKISQIFSELQNSNDFDRSDAKIAIFQRNLIASLKIAEIFADFFEDFAKFAKILPKFCCIFAKF